MMAQAMFPSGTQEPVKLKTAVTFAEAKSLMYVSKVPPSMTAPRR